MTSAPTKPDLLGRSDIIVLVNGFYKKVEADQSLSHIFNGIAKVDWDSHLPRLYDFWDTVIFRSGTFRGDPIGVHTKLLAGTRLDWPLFERWLELFRETLDEHFAGENAGHILRCAEDMARVIHSKIHRISNPRIHSDRLTPEQKTRYASYREAPAV